MCYSTSVQMTLPCRAHVRFPLENAYFSRNFSNIKAGNVVNIVYLKKRAFT